MQEQMEIVDTNQDGIINILDVVVLVNLVISGGEYNENADMNYDQILNIQDILILIQEILNN